MFFSKYGSIRALSSSFAFVVVVSSNYFVNLTTVLVVLLSGLWFLLGCDNTSSAKLKMSWRLMTRLSEFWVAAIMVLVLRRGLYQIIIEKSRNPLTKNEINKSETHYKGDRKQFCTILHMSSQVTLILTQMITI